MNVEYDRDVDAVDVSISDEVSRFTQVVDDVRVVDYGADGKMVGLEFFGASRGVRLSGLPLQMHGIRAHELAEALKEAGVPVVDDLVDLAQAVSFVAFNAAPLRLSAPTVIIAGAPQIRITDHSGFQSVG
jgi:uncharacterized protein YuzE